MEKVAGEIFGLGGRLMFLQAEANVGISANRNCLFILPPIRGGCARSLAFSVVRFLASQPVVATTLGTNRRTFTANVDGSAAREIRWLDEAVPRLYDDSTATCSRIPGRKTCPSELSFVRSLF